MATRTRSRARRRVPRLTTAELHKALAREPLVGVSAAAGILGVKTPNFSRYRDRLTAIEVEGSAAVFFRSEVEALAQTLAAERGRG